MLPKLLILNLPKDKLTHLLHKINFIDRLQTESNLIYFEIS